MCSIVQTLLQHRKNTKPEEMVNKLFGYHGNWIACIGVIVAVNLVSIGVRRWCKAELRCDSRPDIRKVFVSLKPLPISPVFTGMDDYAAAVPEKLSPESAAGCSLREQRYPHVSILSRYDAGDAIKRNLQPWHETDQGNLKGGGCLVWYYWGVKKHFRLHWKQTVGGNGNNTGS